MKKPAFRRIISFALALIMLVGMLAAPTSASETEDYGRYVFDRDELENLIYKLRVEKKLNIVYLGGSVTDGYGSSAGGSWRELVGKWFEDTFAESEINNYNASIGGSGSMSGAFRLETDVLSHAPDLVFVEAAVNDGYCGHFADGTVQTYYETILRKIREQSPDTEIISIFVNDKSTLVDHVNYDLSKIAALQNEVADYYDVTGINVGRAVQNRIVETYGASRLDEGWAAYIKDYVHPLNAGYRVYADVIIAYLNSKLSDSAATPEAVVPHTCPQGFFDKGASRLETEYVKVSPEIFTSMTGWTYSEDAIYPKIDTAGCIYPSADENSFTYRFNGTGLAILMEFSGGQFYFDISIDGKEPERVDMYDTSHPFHKAIENLEPGDHTVTISYVGMNIDEDNNKTAVPGHDPRVKLSRFFISKERKIDLIGDINGDNIIDTADYIYFARALAGVAGYKDLKVAAYADLNGDKFVTPADLAVLARHLAAWKGYASLPIANSDSGADESMYSPKN